MRTDSWHDLGDIEMPRLRLYCGLIAGALLGVSVSACKRAETPAAAEAPASTVVSAITPAAQTAAKQITGDFLRDQITKFSADEFEGRGPATPADQRARAYLIDQLKAIGAAPAGTDGSWEQSFDVVGVTAKMPAQWTFKRGNQALGLKWWDQYIAGSGVQTEQGGIKDAEVVFVGYGIEAPEYQWDDFKGEDLKGKVLLMLNNDPDWDPQLFAGNARLYYGRWVYKYESAARRGAAGAIIIHTTPSAGYPFQVVQTSWSGEQVELPAASEPRLQVKAWVTEEAARALTSMAGQDLTKLIESARSRDFKPIPLGITTSLAFTNTLKRSQTANVYGVVQGSDPTLRDEYVIYTAHHDHLGVGEPDASGDKIYNGAKDNAAGVAQVLAIAKAFKALPQPPRRSAMFLFVAAEEQGLLGSKYYAGHPTIPPGKMAANINYDGGNIWGRAKDVVYIGKGKSSLDGIVESIAKEQGRIVHGDQFPDRGVFYRSDQFNFAKIGVPALYLKDSVEIIGKPEGWGKQRVEEFEAKQYHQPSDEIDPTWVFDGMVEDAQLGFYVGLVVATNDELPMWVPGDEFEAARKKALAAAR
jgi:Zn-dependent M28 family amino/carboxypeptidase